ncbi:hypothetical protein QJS10_CPA02g01456 [Acorus calamus]|uniref:SCP domain-containing protein n=1 Tax=Acorus calamus TaxID=4465 RepID=A0AAV9FE14_ACOCL|nr:hypothetical protein QJS10_CPA02g01456 [Acorus calamus]
MPLHCILITLFISIITTTAHPPLSPLTPDNQTTYTVSKKLCWAWGCLSEPLEFLFVHNMVRAPHWELPLVWDSQLESYARWWAGQRKADCRLQHSFPEGGFTLGENVFWGGYGVDWTPTDAVQAWAGEWRYYTYATNACEKGRVCGHYTQIVWRNTRRIGCARVVCDGKRGVFITCNYYPPGNYIGQRPY